MNELANLLLNGIPTGDVGVEARRLCEQLLSDAPKADAIVYNRDTPKCCCDRVLLGCKSGELTPNLVADLEALLTYLPSGKVSQDQIETVEFKVPVEEKVEEKVEENEEDD